MSSTISREFFNLQGSGAFRRRFFAVPDDPDGNRARFGVYNLQLGGEARRYEDEYSDLWLTGIKIKKTVDGGGVKTAAKALMFGSFDGDEMRGFLLGLKLGEENEQLSILQGPVFGLYSSGVEGDSWLGTSVGTWKKHVLKTEGFSLFHNSGGSIVKWARDPALVDLTFGQNSERTLLAVGEYFEVVPGAYAGPSVQATRMSGDLVGPRTESYEGFLTGKWLGGAIDGMAAAIYLSSDGSAGILTGDMVGIYAGIGDGEGMWTSQGRLSALEIATGLNLTQEQFHASISAEGSSKTPVINGAFLTDADAGSGKIGLTERSWKSLSLENQSWSISSVVYAGSYEGNPSDRWAWNTAFIEKGVKKFESVTGSKWSNETVSAQYTGGWVNWEKAVTGVMGGQLKGTFNPSLSTWQAVSSGTNLETSQFMDMIAAGKTDALQKLNIPSVEIGRATLSGSSALLKNVQMKDVTFFAYTAGASPKIWATNNVSGSFTGVPSAGHQVGLSGGGLNANLTVQNWANNNWGANVAGSGTLTRTDVKNTNVNVSFEGAAAGTYTGTNSGTFKGTGAGTAK